MIKASDFTDEDAEARYKLSTKATAALEAKSAMETAIATVPASEAARDEADQKKQRLWDDKTRAWNAYHNTDKWRLSARYNAHEYADGLEKAYRAAEDDWKAKNEKLEADEKKLLSSLASHREAERVEALANEYAIADRAERQASGNCSIGQYKVDPQTVEAGATPPSGWCRLCPTGTYQLECSTTRHECVPCPTDTYQDREGQKICQISSDKFYLENSNWATSVKPNWLSYDNAQTWAEHRPPSAPSAPPPLSLPTSASTARQISSLQNSKVWDDGHGKIYMGNSHAGDNQRFFIEPVNGDASAFKIHIKSNPSKCLDYHYHANKLYVGDCHGGNNQIFYLQSADVGDGTADGRLNAAYISTKHHSESNRVLDYNPGNGDMYFGTKHGGANQKFYFI